MLGSPFNLIIEYMYALVSNYIHTPSLSENELLFVVLVHDRKCPGFISYSHTLFLAHVSPTDMQRKVNYIKRGVIGSNNKRIKFSKSKKKCRILNYIFLLFFFFLPPTENPSISFYLANFLSHSHDLPLLVFFFGGIFKERNSH